MLLVIVDVDWTVAISSFHSIHNVADRSVLQAMWEDLRQTLDTAINSLSANHAYPNKY